MLCYVVELIVDFFSHPHLKRCLHNDRLDGYQFHELFMIDMGFWKINCSVDHFIKLLLGTTL